MPSEDESAARIGVEIARVHYNSIPNSAAYRKQKDQANFALGQAERRLGRYTGCYYPGETRTRCSDEEVVSIYNAMLKGLADHSTDHSKEVYRPKGKPLNSSPYDIRPESSQSPRREIKAGKVCRLLGF